MRQVLFMQESRDCDDKEQARSGPEAAEGKSSPWTDTAIPYDVDFGLSRCMPTANENRRMRRRAQFRRARFSRRQSVVR